MVVCRWLAVALLHPLERIGFLNSMAGRDRMGFVGMHGAACLQAQATTSNGTAEAKAKQQTSSGMQMGINSVQQISSNRQKGPRRLQEK